MLGSGFRVRGSGPEVKFPTITPSPINCDKLEAA